MVRRWKRHASGSHVALKDLNKTGLSVFLSKYLQKVKAKAHACSGPINKREVLGALYWENHSPSILRGK